MKLGKNRAKEVSNNKLPQINPKAQCNLKKLRLERLKDILSIERDFIQNQEIIKPNEQQEKDNKEKVESIRGMPLQVSRLQEMINDNHAIIAQSNTMHYYVPVLSIVDRKLLQPGAEVLVHNRTLAVVGVLQNDEDPHVTVMKVDKAPLESYQILVD